MILRRGKGKKNLKHGDACRSVKRRWAEKWKQKQFGFQKRCCSLREKNLITWKNKIQISRLKAKINKKWQVALRGLGQVVAEAAVAWLRRVRVPLLVLQQDFLSRAHEVVDVS